RGALRLDGSERLAGPRRGALRAGHERGPLLEDADRASGRAPPPPRGAGRRVHERGCEVPRQPVQQVSAADRPRHPGGLRWRRVRRDRRPRPRRHRPEDLGRAQRHPRRRPALPARWAARVPAPLGRGALQPDREGGPALGFDPRRGDRGRAPAPAHARGRRAGRLVAVLRAQPDHRRRPAPRTHPEDGGDRPPRPAGCAEGRRAARADAAGTQARPEARGGLEAMRTTTRLAQWLRRSGPFDRDRMPSLGELAPRPLPVKASRRLFVVDLPEGDVPGFTIDVPGWTGHTADRKWTSTWLSEGYDGILFRGKGKDKTRIVPNGVESTVMFDRMPGVVRFENLTVVCGSRHGIWAGLEHPEEDVEPLFRLETFHVDVLSSGPRTTWGVFTIQCDVDLRSGTIDTTNGLEHTLYVHGVAQFGVYLLNMTFRSTAECVKIRSSTTETRAVPGAALGVQSCVFAFWYRDGSSRGGGGVVCQGTGLKGISVKGCFFRNLGPNCAIPSNQRTREIMIDDGEGDYYSALDGTPREG